VELAPVLFVVITVAVASVVLCLYISFQY